jgi:hypothetical protein
MLAPEEPTAHLQTIAELHILMPATNHIFTMDTWFILQIITDLIIIEVAENIIFPLPGHITTRQYVIIAPIAQNIPDGTGAITNAATGDKKSKNAE